MLVQRLSGLAQLYVWCTALLVAGLFLALAAAEQYLPWITLNPSVNVTLCVLVIGAGMLAGGRFVSTLGGRFQALNWSDAARLATRQVGTMTLLGFTVVVATKDRTISRLFLALFIVLSWAGLMIANRILPRLLARVSFGRHRVRTLFVGKIQQLDQLAEWISQTENLGIMPVGFLADDRDRLVHKHGGPLLGSSAQLASVINAYEIDQVMVLDPPGRDDEMGRIIECCQDAGCRLLVYDSIVERLPLQMRPTIEAGHLFLTMQDEPLEDPLNRIAKRAFDVVVSLGVVVLVLPAITLLVWLIQQRQAPGPVFFVRPRGSQRRSEFMMLKFRTMYFDSQAAVNDEAVQVRRGDSRIYPFGRLLRRTSLDELPQFLNVLLGDMSVVGPRPHLPKHDHEFSKMARAYRTRHLVKPGITGLAQVAGYRGEISDAAVLRRRVEHDILYIVQWSIWLDLQITLKTAWHVLFPPPAAR